jgi:F-type H+-transporting ATPase subunit delta
LISQSIAKRYAKGLFAVGEKDGKYRAYFEELDRLLALFEGEKRLKKALMLPLLEMDKRKELLSDVMKAAAFSLPLSNLLRMLLEKNRMGYLPMIKDQYGELVDAKEGRVKGTLWSPFPVDTAVRTRIEGVLGEKMKKQVVLSTVEDKSLIGGMKIQIRGTIIDGSVKKQLETMRENILKE